MRWTKISLMLTLASRREKLLIVHRGENESAKCVR